MCCCQRGSMEHIGSCDPWAVVSAYVLEYTLLLLMHHREFSSLMFIYFDKDIYAN